MTTRLLLWTNKFRVAKTKPFFLFFCPKDNLQERGGPIRPGGDHLPAGRALRLEPEAPRENQLREPEAGHRASGCRAATHPLGNPKREDRLIRQALCLQGCNILLTNSFPRCVPVSGGLSQTQTAGVVIRPCGVFAQRLCGRNLVLHQPRVLPHVRTNNRSAHVVSFTRSKFFCLNQNETKLLPPPAGAFAERTPKCRRGGRLI